MRQFIDTETGKILSVDELMKEYTALRESGDTEAETFADYISNCLTKNNGTLEELEVET